MSFNITGKMKVSTVKSRFKEEFGLTLRVYDGRSFSDENKTVAAIRKKQGSGELSVRKSMLVGNLEEKILDLFGIKCQIAGSDDSYLCDNKLSLAGALKKDASRITRKNEKSKVSESASNESLSSKGSESTDSEDSDEPGEDNDESGEFQVLLIAHIPKDWQETAGEDTLIMLGDTEESNLPDATMLTIVDDGQSFYEEDASDNIAEFGEGRFSAEASSLMAKIIKRDFNVQVSPELIRNAFLLIDEELEEDVIGLRKIDGESDEFRNEDQSYNDCIILYSRVEDRNSEGDVDEEYGEILVAISLEQSLTADDDESDIHKYTHMLCSLDEGDDLLANQISELANADLSVLEQAAEQANMELDYSIEQILEAATLNAAVMGDVVNRVRDYWLEIESIPGGTHFEVNIRAAEFLAAVNLTQSIAVEALAEMANSENWRERLVCAWTVRDMLDADALNIKTQLAQDSFVDDNGLYLVREGIGLHED